MSQPNQCYMRGEERTPCGRIEMRVPENEQTTDTAEVTCAPCQREMVLQGWAEDEDFNHNRNEDEDEDDDE